MFRGSGAGCDSGGSPTESAAAPVGSSNRADDDDGVYVLLTMRRRPAIVARARVVAHRIDDRRVPRTLKARWVDVAGVDEGWAARLRRDRVEIVPWLERTRALGGTSIVE